MKNGCIIVKQNNDLLSDNAFGGNLDPFCATGYRYEEVRILLQTEERKIIDTILSYRKEFDTIVLWTEKGSLPLIRKYIGEAFPEGIYQGGLNGAGIYDDKKTTLFLLSNDCSDTGLQYAKEVCVPYLQRKSGGRTGRFVVRSVGANEIMVDRLLIEAQNRSGDKVCFRRHRKYGEDIIEAVYDENASKVLIDDSLRIFADTMGESIYALEDIRLEEQLVRLLKLRGRKLSVAESFTGGGIARRIVSVSGASEVYFEGLNTYDELSKRKRLDVSEYTLKTFGAVSDQTAYEMASGLLKTGDCDISIATTGLAGPKTDRSMLPIGLCYIAVGVKERVFVYRYKFEGTREEITETAINYAMFLAYKQLKNI